MSIATLKVGVGFVVVAAAAVALQTSAVWNALLLFAAAGIVPGTDIVLSPNTTMIILGVALFGVAALLFWKNIKQFFVGASRQAGSTPEEAVGSLAEQAVEVAPVAPTKRRVRLFVAAATHRLRRALQRTRQVVVQHAVAAKPIALRQAQALLWQSGRAWILAKSAAARLRTWVGGLMSQHEDMTIARDFLKHTAKTAYSWTAKARTQVRHLRVSK